MTDQLKRSKPGLLDHLLVLDFADERGAFCSKLLGDLGAKVIKVHIAGRPSPKWNAPESLFHNAEKHSISIDTNSRYGKQKLRGLIQSADIIIETESHDFLQPDGINPGTILISITPFGQGGETEDTQTADCPELSGCEAYSTASLFGAVAAVLRLRKRRMIGIGSFVDLSICEAIASMLEFEIIESFHKPPVDVAPVSQDGFSVLRAKDGYIQIPVLRDWYTLLELMASEGKAEDLVNPKWRDYGYRVEHYSEILSIVQRWIRTYGRRELQALGQSMGFPWASVETVEETIENPQLKSRDFFVHFTLPGGRTFAFPGSPYRCSSSELDPSYPIAQIKRPDLPLPDFIRPEIQSATSKRCLADENLLQGIRVLDLTRMIAGPYATRIMADFGAEVIKIQTHKTATGAERSDSPNFGIWNRNKRSIILDLGTPIGRSAFLQLVACSDIVVENFSPRVMANWRLEYEQLREVNPALIMVRISAMGQTGPWRNFVGFAPNFHALSGIIAEKSGDQSAAPADLNFPYADIISGLYAALVALSALESRGKNGQGQYMDVSALESICAIRSSKYGHPPFANSRESGSDSRGSNYDAGKEWLESGDSFGVPGKWVSSILNKLESRKFLVRLQHPLHGEVLAVRTALWDWRYEPNWKAAPALGEYNEILEVRSR